MPVMHQAVKAFLANQRQGNASTKTRGFVVGGNQKPWKQKGTGRARQGSTRAPHWVGGGTVFGPTPRSYDAVRAAAGPRAGAQERAQRARARGRDLRHRCVRLRRAEDRARCSALVERARRGRQEGADPHGRREAERVPQRPQPAERARDAVRRRLDLPHPLVGRRADRGGRDRRDARAGGRDEPRRVRSESAQPRRSAGEARGHAGQGGGEDVRQGEAAKKAAKKTAKAAAKSAAKKPSAKKSTAKKSAAKKSAQEEGRSKRCRLFIAPSCVRSSPRRRSVGVSGRAANTRSRCTPDANKPADPPGDRDSCSA